MSAAGGISKIPDTYSSHGVDGVFTEFLPQLFPLLETNTMLASNRTLHLNSTPRHSAHEFFGFLLFGIVVQENG